MRNVAHLTGPKARPVCATYYEASGSKWPLGMPARNTSVAACSISFEGRSAQHLLQTGLMLALAVAFGGALNNSATTSRHSQMSNRQQMQ
jgi:hypothetical protein